MGKKSKVGKQRKDKYYHLAKETGYRSRAAFKLIQLNRKFGFLQKSRVCIDLCAAPGGWMQVAHENMPLSSIVVGIDLFPIKTVPGCISLVEDITTDKCKTALTKELKTWKADVVLNDGAPNVGLNWIHDAYQQTCLTLSALKLATNFLKPGGWFVTKVFRSKDYHALIWVLKQLFKKVHATKPQASRNESSEIFVVCQNYIAPDHIDPKFLDPKYVFEEIDLGSKNKLNILHPEKQKKAKAEGYKDNDYTLHHQVPVSDFLVSGDPIEALRGCSEIIFDDKEVEAHELTTKEIKECCKDIKLLGRKDVKALLKWLKAMKDIKSDKDTNKPVKEAEVQQEDVKGTDDEDEEVDAQIAELQDEERRDLKRKRKHLTKQRVKLAEKMNLKMVVKSDSGPTLKSTDLFQLKDIKSMKDIDKVAEQQPDILAQSDDESDDDTKLKPKYMKYNAEDTHLDSSGKYYKDSDSELEMESDSSDSDKETLGFSDSDEEKSNKKLKKITKKNTLRNAAVAAGNDDDSDTEHPLLPSLDTAEPRDRRYEKAQMWFQKDSFKDLEDDEDEDIDLDKLADSYKKKGKNISESAITKESTVLTKTKKQRQSVTDSGVSSEDTDTDYDTDTDSDYDVEETVQPKGKEDKPGKAEKAGGKGKSKDTFEIVSQDRQLKGLKKLVKMDQETLAMGTMMATSKKYKRDLVDNAWNRYTFDDKNLPDWFVEDEAKNMRKPVEVTKEVEEEYRNRLQEINSRPIKKVIEAKARKKKRMVKKMERAKKKVEAVMENGDMSEREKAKQVKQLYKKAHADPKKDVTYVVAKKHSTGARVRRPAGVKGQYRVVDARMKKDLRAARNKEKTKGRKKTSTKKGQARPKKQKSK